MTRTPDDDRRRDAYHNTSSDGEAAEFLGIELETFRDWRRRRGLPAKGRHRCLSAEEDAHRRAVLFTSASYPDAAAKLNMTPKALRNWAKYNKLIPPFIRPPHRLPEDARRLAAYHATPNDMTAARTLSLNVAAFGVWRRKNTLTVKRGRLVRAPPLSEPGRKPRPRLSDEELGRRFRAYVQLKHWRLRAVARELGLTRDAYRGWMREYGLRDHHADKGNAAG